MHPRRECRLRSAAWCGWEGRLKSGQSGLAALGGGAREAQGAKGLVACQSGSAVDPGHAPAVHDESTPEPPCCGSLTHVHTLPKNTKMHRLSTPPTPNTLQSNAGCNFLAWG